MESCIPSTPSRKQRTSNWSATEVDILIEEIKSNYGVLFGHFSSQVSASQKKKLWTDIVTKINANGKTVRDVPQAKKKWADLKSITRKKAAHQKKEQSKTGGGLPDTVIDLTEFENKIISIIPACQVQGIEGGLESEACELPQPDMANYPEESDTQDSVPTSSATTSAAVPEFQQCDPTLTNSEVEIVLPCEQKRVKYSTNARSSENLSLSILEVEREKLCVQRDLLATEKERLAVEKERLAVEREILHCLRQQTSNESDLFLSPVIPF
ncbi:myb/SANT-like DNA-binding domain-containing protein 4 [Haliotis rubra]|uniref:myb/SANT-like DNA-binding domain-containing protein 4 n=1 Tax=Haliotis rubra TaxID=36100 RepID=UPI001EE5B324|nr:myb/SANT-like DNA-binding domain-containing protein 4 [Haliotis rubra]